MYWLSDIKTVLWKLAKLTTFLIFIRVWSDFHPGAFELLLFLFRLAFNCSENNCPLKYFCLHCKCNLAVSPYFFCMWLLPWTYLPCYYQAVIQCSPLPIRPGLETYCSASTYRDSQCTFSCSTGFRLEGHNSTTCEKRNTRGEWTHQPPECLGKSDSNYKSA